MKTSSLNPEVSTPRFLLDRTGIDPPRDRGKEFGSMFALEAADTANVGGFEFLRKFCKDFCPIDTPATAGASTALSCGRLSPRALGCKASAAKPSDSRNLLKFLFESSQFRFLRLDLSREAFKQLLCLLLKLRKGADTFAGHQ
ncbi:MAG: hypothetical protein ACLQAT_18865 [Candidatus Binataceae bacterium]